MRDPRLRPFRGPLVAFALMLSVQAVTGAVLFAGKIGFSSGRVLAFYRGSEAAFTRPRSLAGLLEVAVPHLLAVPTVLLVAVHLVGFVRLVRPRVAGLLSGAIFGSALLDIASGFVIRFLWPGLAWVKVASFASFESLLVLWLVLLVRILVPPRGTSAGRVLVPRTDASCGLPARPPSQQRGRMRA